MSGFLSLICEQDAKGFARSGRVSPDALGVPVVGLFSAHGVYSGDKRSNARVLGHGLGREKDECKTHSIRLFEPNRCLPFERNDAWSMS